MTPTIEKKLKAIQAGKVPAGYRKTAVGIVPKEWEVVRFYDKFLRITRKNAEGNTNVLTISAQHGLINQNDFFKKNIASEDKSNYYLLRKGEFAYNKSYSNGYPFGALKRLDFYDKGIVSPLYICFAANDSNRCSDFYVHYFEAGLMNREIQAFAQEGARNHGLLNISVDDFFKANLLSPPLPEQRKIAEILTAQDRVIALKEKLVTEKRKQKKFLMNQLLSCENEKKITINDIKIDKTKWIFKTIGDVCSTFSGGTPNRSHSEYFNGSIPWIKSGELNKENIYQTEEFLTQKGIENSSTKIVKKGTLLIAMYGATAGILAFTHIDAAINQAILALVPKIEINLFYLKYALENKIDIAVHKYVQGGQPNFNATIIESFKIEFPTLPEQQAIAEVLSAADREISLREQDLEQERKKKKSLMQLLLSGLVRVNTPEDSHEL